MPSMKKYLLFDGRRSTELMNPKEEEIPGCEDIVAEDESEQPIESKGSVSSCVTCITQYYGECDHRVGLEDIAAVSGNVAGKVSRRVFRIGKAWTSGFFKGFRDE